MAENYRARSSEAPAARILLIAGDDERARELRELLLAFIPTAVVARLDTETLSVGALPAAEGVMIDVSAARGAVDAFRTVRGRGFEGRVVLVAQSEDDGTLNQAVNALGNAACLTRDAIVAKPARLAETILCGTDDSSPGMRALVRARRVLAAGEAALSLQHGINNPLAALLAEAQLLQLEELSPEQRSSTDRIVELCRRIVTLVQRLDGLAAAHPG
jgi:nitrogen-specific signal transduction histidine kinase